MRSKKGKKQEERGSTNFDSLSRDLKELIWDKMEGKELYKKRAVCKDWREGLDNARRPSLKEKMEKCEERKEIESKTYKYVENVEGNIILKFLVTGDAGVGKSCLILRYVDDSYTDTYISSVRHLTK